MPHKRFIKGSPEAISHMQSLRERRKGHKHKTETETETETTEPAKEPEPTATEEIIPTKKARRARIKKEKIQEIIKDAVESYFNQR